MFTHKRDPNPDLIWLLIWIGAWIIFIFQSITQQRYIQALCMFYCCMSVMMKQVTSLFGFKLHPFIQWGYLFIGAALLFLQFGYQDLYQYTQIANVLFILIGCWGVWSIGKKK